MGKLTDELLDYLGEMYQRESIFAEYELSFDEFVELWTSGLWELQAQTANMIKFMKQRGVVVDPNYIREMEKKYGDKNNKTT